MIYSEINTGKAYLITGYLFGKIYKSGSNRFDILHPFV